MRLFFASLVPFALCASSVLAQSATADRTESQISDRAPQASEDQADASHRNLDHHIAACLLLGNQEEIALAQYAEQHAQHAKVKEFAKLLIDQHGKAVAAIQKSAPDIADLQLVMIDAGSAGDDESSPENASTGSDPSIAMMQQVKSQCLALTQKELEQYEGAEFDKAFVGQQVGAHVGMLAQLRGSKSFASPELQKVIAEGEKMTVMHMAAAKKIMDEIKDKTNQTASADQRKTAPKR